MSLMKHFLSNNRFRYQSLCLVTVQHDRYDKRFVKPKIGSEADSAAITNLVEPVIADVAAVVLRRTSAVLSNSNTHVFERLHLLHNLNIHLGVYHGIHCVRADLSLLDGEHKIFPFECP